MTQLDDPPSPGGQAMRGGAPRPRARNGDDSNGAIPSGASPVPRSVDHAGFLLELSDRIGELEDPQDLVAVALSMLGTYLGADRAGFGDVDGERGAIVALQEWGRPGRNAASALSLMDVPGGSEAFRTGRVQRVPAGRNAMSPGASVTVPLLKEGAPTALLYLGRDDGRAWTEEEAALAENVGQRLMRAVERVCGRPPCGTTRPASASSRMRSPPSSGSSIPI